MKNIDEEVHKFWNRVASDWEVQVGEDGDSNRRLNSDPVLWKFVGNVQDLLVLDAGCGTGYLARKLASKGAVVTGIDVSEKMIDIAQQKSNKNNKAIDFYVDTCAKLGSLKNDYFDIIVANYVLMDVTDLEGTMKAFNRVLKSNGNAVVVFSHPCFPQGARTTEEGKISYNWSFPYFERRKRIDPPWGHFTSEFIWFHRPLSDYWKAFKDARFEVIDFEEPRITEERFHLAENERKLENSKTRPYSVAFKLRKARSI